MARFEFLIHGSGQSQRVALKPLPFVLGRESTANFVVPNTTVSKKHAMVCQRDGEYWIHDLGSSNGTFLNAQLISEASLTNGDVVHLAQAEFQFFDDRFDDDSLENGAIPKTDLLKKDSPFSVFSSRPLLRRMIESRAVRTVYQPIVDLYSRSVLGYEALGRGDCEKLTDRPNELFRIAHICALAGDLSRAFRNAALAESRMLPAGPYVFCNLHPDELTSLLPKELDRLLPALPDGRKLVLEVPEDAIEDVALMCQLRDQLRRLGFGLAFDDFGVGKSRLSVLADAPPDFIKIDMRLVRDIDTLPGRQDVVGSICDLAAYLNVKVIAEGLETLAEVETCRSLGCQFGQGYLLGHPEVSTETPTVSSESVTQ
jgi:EAL domain-containing protein (putative c-di-GMP-specific phosphodiesterase class I)